MAHQSGFSVIEAMVGFLILGITISALFGGFSFGFNSIKLSQEEVRADQILVQKLESIRVYNWTNITSTYILPNFTAYYSTSNAVHGVTYNGSMSVTPFVPSATPESYSSTLRQVTATVSWFSEGMNHTRTMMTLVSSNGIATYQP
jgi:Tfp pilus assembly protein PilV